MARRGYSLDKLIDRLAIQIAHGAIALDAEEKFTDKLDALKALTNLKSVKAKTQQEPEGGGIDEFTKLFSSDSGVGGDSEPDDDDPDYDPTETDHTDAGVSGDLTGVGRAQSGADPAGQRHHDRLDGGE